MQLWVLPPNKQMFHKIRSILLSFVTRLDTKIMVHKPLENRQQIQFGAFLQRKPQHKTFVDFPTAQKPDAKIVQSSGSFWKRFHQGVLGGRNLDAFFRGRDERIWRGINANHDAIVWWSMRSGGWCIVFRRCWTRHFVTIFHQAFFFHLQSTFGLCNQRRNAVINSFFM